MALKAILDTLDGVPDTLKSEYVEQDGKFVLQVDGMKPETDFTKVHLALSKERNDFKTYREQFAPLAGKKVDEIVAQLDRIPELEAAAKGNLDEEKINSIVEGRIKTRLAPVERERDTYKAQVAEKDQVITRFQTQEKTTKIHEAVRKAAVAAKIVPEAIDDALMLADRHLELDDSGRVVVKDGFGVTPGVTPDVWFMDLQKSRGHWWGPTVGGGAGGNRGGAGGMANPFSAEHWNLTEQGKLVNSDPQKAEQLAKAAGTTVGGMRPKPKS